MEALHQRTFDLDALCAEAGRLLASAAAVPEDQRVAAVPDARTVRYYQSIGVVDRPLRYDGRQAVYGWRHLLQVVATKLLQTRGHSLAQVQAALSGLSDARLEEAVRPALGGSAELATIAPAAVAPVAVEPVRALVAAEVAPGVFVTVDPSRVADPHAVLAQIRAALVPQGGLS